MYYASWCFISKFIENISCFIEIVVFFLQMHLEVIFSSVFHFSVKSKLYYAFNFNAFSCCVVYIVFINESYGVAILHIYKYVIRFGVGNT